MNFARIFANAFARRLAYVAVAALLAWCGVSRAQSVPISDTHDYLDQAYAHCATFIAYADINNAGYAPHRCERQGFQITLMGIGGRAVLTGATTDHQAILGECPSGRIYSQNKCILDCPSGYSEDPYHTGQCMDEDKCLSLNDGRDPNAVTTIQSANGEHCPAVGCLMRRNCQTGLCTTFVGDSGTISSGPYVYTGGSCGRTATPPPPLPDPPKKQECLPISGQTVCVKPNGDHCYPTAKAGRQTCWHPGETGEKSDADNLQKRVAGLTEIPPNLNLPSGDQLQKNGQSTTNTTNVTNNNNSSNVTTTTTNYTTVNGTNAGTQDQGEPATGEGSPDGDEDGNGASGGTDCETPPTVTGDAALGMIATQAWKTRCAAEANNNVTTTGDITNCEQPFTVEGTQANTVELRAMRKTICPLESENFDPTSVDLGEAGSPDGFIGEEIEVGTSGLDDEGMGFSRTCPTIPPVNVMGQTITFDTSVFCDWLTLGGQFVLIAAALVSLAIMAGGGAPK